MDRDVYYSRDAAVKVYDGTGEFMFKGVYPTVESLIEALSSRVELIDEQISDIHHLWSEHYHYEHMVFMGSIRMTIVFPRIL